MGSHSEFYSEKYNERSSMDSINKDLEINDSRMSRTKIYSYTRMIMVRKNCTITRWTRRCSEIETFTLNCESLHKVPIVDAAIEGYDQHSGTHEF